jgi:galactonate dehydratase
MVMYKNRRTFPRSLAAASAVSLTSVPIVHAALPAKDGKLWPNERPGLGVELDLKPLTQMLEVTAYNAERAQYYTRPDGSITNW